MSSKDYRIVNVLPHCNSLLIRERNDNVKIRQNRMCIHVREVEKVKEREILCTVTSDPKIEGTTQVKQARKSSESTDDNFC